VRKDAKGYVFLLDVTWSSGHVTHAHRNYKQFFEFQCKVVFGFGGLFRLNFYILHSCSTCFPPRASRTSVPFRSCPERS
jgi:hypothetical protein